MSDKLGNRLKDYKNGNADPLHPYYLPIKAIMAAVKSLSDKERDYNLLLQCYRSGQISERQWQQHLQDEGLRNYIEGVNNTEDTTGKV